MTARSGATPAAAQSPRHRLDPRRPLVLDTRELGRRPGSMRRTQRTDPAPPELGGQGMAVIAPGSDLVLDLRLESVMEGVLVTGTVEATMSGECGRCLEPVSTPVTAQILELFRYPESGPYGAKQSRSQPADDDDDELPLLVDDLIDLEPVLRDALVLELPLAPLCRPDCSGLCVGCGGRLDDLPADHSHDTVDPRWAALSGLVAPAVAADDSDPALTDVPDRSEEES